MDTGVREVEILTSCFQRADKSRQDVTEEFLCEVLARAKDQCLRMPEPPMKVKPQGVSWRIFSKENCI